MASGFTAATSKKTLVKPEKPDEAAFRVKLAVAEKELEEARESMNAIKAKLALAEPPRQDKNDAATPNSVHQKQAALRAELSSIRGKQSTFKASRQKIHDEIKALDTSLKAKIAEQKAARAKIPFKTVDEIEEACKKLEAQIESGTMTLVGERKAIADQSAFRRHKKTLQKLDEGEAAINKEKAKIAALKSQLVDDPEQKKLSDRYSEINAELDAIKAEQDAVYKNLSSLRDERSRLRALENERYQAKKKIEDEYFAAKKAYAAWEKAANETRRERIRAEREARELEYKKKLAKEKMEEATIPAYSSEILTCENLIAHFDPTSPEAIAQKTKVSLLKDAGLKATASRVVEDEPKGKKLASKEDREGDFYFVGKPKKGKKGSNRGSGAATPTTPAVEDRGKFQLNHGILVELGKVGIRAPVSWDDVPKCVEMLREKLNYYKENSEAKTKENIAKAQKEIDRIYGKTDDFESTENKEATEETQQQKEGEEEEAEKPLPVPSTIVEETKDETKAEYSKDTEVKEGEESKEEDKAE